MSVLAPSGRTLLGHLAFGLAVLIAGLLPLLIFVAPQVLRGTWNGDVDELRMLWVALPYLLAAAVLALPGSKVPAALAAATCSALSLSLSHPPALDPLDPFGEARDAPRQVDLEKAALSPEDRGFAEISGHLDPHHFVDEYRISPGSRPDQNLQAPWRWVVLRPQQPKPKLEAGEAIVLARLQTPALEAMQAALKQSEASSSSEGPPPLWATTLRGYLKPAPPELLWSLVDVRGATSPTAAQALVLDTERWIDQEKGFGALSWLGWGQKWGQDSGQNWGRCLAMAILAGLALWLWNLAIPGTLRKRQSTPGSQEDEIP